MLSLSEITHDTRQILKYAGLGLGGLLILYFIVKLGIFIYQRSFPTPPPPPTESFNKLPQISFPSIAGNQGITYQLNTITGDLPTFPDRLPVIKLVQNEPNLLAIQNVRQALSSNNIGFSINEIQLSNTLFQWANPDGSVIRYNILTNNFTIDSNYLFNPANTSYQMPAEDQVAQFPLTYLGNMNEDTTDIDPTLTRVTYYNINNGKLIQTTNPVTAMVARVDLFQSNISVPAFVPYQNTVNSLPVYYANPGFSSMYFFIEPENFDFKVVQASFTHHVINTTDKSLSATYPIKTAAQAYQDLQKGNAFIVNNSNSKNIQISDISLGYFASDSNQNYLMPIVVFKGDKFTAYVSAVSNSAISSQ